MMKMFWMSDQFHKMLDECALTEWKMVFGDKIIDEEAISSIRRTIMTGLLLTQSCIGSC